MMTFTPSQLKKISIVVALTLVWLFAVRFVMATSNAVHYHANFAVFVDGERLPFDGFNFYEEVALCSTDATANPKARVHLHDQISHLVHVHDDASTWGHLFANLSYTLGDEVLRTEQGVFVEDDINQLQFMLNGETVQTAANRTIGNEDVLLISYGSASAEELQAQYDQIMSDAGEYNDKPDPAACSGGDELTLSDRFKQAINLFN